MEFILHVFVLAFFSGVLTVLAPCMLPLLPVVIGTSASARSRWTPVIVIASLSVSIISFTFLIKASTLLIAIPPTFWAYFSGIILLIIGLSFLFPAFWSKLPGMGQLSRSSNAVVGSGYTQKSWWGDVVVGAALGPVFSSCSPTYLFILAAVLPASFWIGSVYLVSYVVGLASVLLLIACLGQSLIGRLQWAADPRGWFKRSIGLILLLVGLAFITGVDKQIEGWLLDIGLSTTQFESEILERAL